MVLENVFTYPNVFPKLESLSFSPSFADPGHEYLDFGEVDAQLNSDDGLILSYNVIYTTTLIHSVLAMKPSV